MRFEELLAALGLLAGFAIWRRLAAAVGARPRGAITPKAADVSIIIPARNEERNLPRLLDSVRALRSPPREVIVVDDGSQDGTVACALRSGARVVNPNEPAPGWSGKSWACQQGAAQAKGELLLFLDADVWFVTPDSLEDALGHFEGSAISLLPFHQTVKAYECLSATFNLIMAWVGLSDQRLFGPSLLITRRIFDQVGGYAQVRSEVLENFFLTDVLRAQGFSPRAVLGKGILAMRMYPGGIPELCAGWSKAFRRGASGSSPWALVLISAWMTGSIAAIILATLGPRVGEGAGLLLLAAFSAQTGFLLSRIGAFGKAGWLLYPIHVAFFQTLFGVSVWRNLRKHPISWRGRRVAVTR